jgi:hypothetical protein
MIAPIGKIAYIEQANLLKYLFNVVIFDLQFIIFHQKGILAGLPGG